MFAQESVMEIQKQKSLYLAKLLEQEVIKQDEFEDLVFKPEINAFHSNYLSSRFMDNINFGWSAWQAAKAQAVPEWIETSERMPDEGEEVLVHSLGQVRQVTRDSKWAGGFKERNCYGWQAAYGQSHWMPKSIELPEQYHFYYENDAKQKAMIEAQEPTND